MRQLIENKINEIKKTIDLFYQDGILIDEQDSNFIDELKADFVLYSLMLKVIEDSKGIELLNHLNMSEEEAIEAIADYDLDFLMCICSTLNYDYGFFLPYILQKQISL